MKGAGSTWTNPAFPGGPTGAAGRGQFDWSIADKVVTHANERGLKILARLSLDPDKQGFWAGDPPASGDAFAEYAGALASRYNCQPGAIGCIQAYQIWNEPNLTREWGSKLPNHAEFADLIG